MSKSIKNHTLFLSQPSEFSPSRRWLLKALGLTSVPQTLRMSSAASCEKADEPLQKLEQEILSTQAIVDRLIIRQGLAERALWRAPADLLWQMALDAIDRDLTEAHERLAQFIARLNDSPATTLLGLRVKARLMAFDDEIAQSLRDDILALPDWPG